MASGAPVDRRLGPIRESGAEQLEEDDLVPADVVRVVTAQLAPPVVDRPQSFHRSCELGDSCLGVHPRVISALYGCVLCRQAERVEAERAQYGVALHRSVPDQDVTEGVVADVSLVSGTAGVGIHAQHVVGRSRVVEVDPVGPVFIPAPLPAHFGLAKVVFRHGNRLVGRCGPLEGAGKHRGSTGSAPTRFARSEAVLRTPNRASYTWRPIRRP